MVKDTKLGQTIDILVATYNGEKYIKEQIDSLLSQTYKDINILVCDDMSMDGTYNILFEYSKKHHNIKIIRNEKNLGYIKNFEKLISLSNSDYFMLCDQDDVWYDTKVEKSVETIIKKNVDLVFTDLCVVDKKLNVINKSFNYGMGIFADRLKNDWEIYHKNYATGCTIIASRDIKDKLLPFIELDKEGYIHDWFLLVVSTLGKGFYYLNEPTILYRQHINNNVGYKVRTEKNMLKKIKKIQENRSYFINSRLSFFDKLNKRYNDEFKKFYNYVEKIDRTKYFNLDLRSFFKYCRCESLKRKLVYLVMLHFPCNILNKKKWKKLNMW